MHKIYVLRNLCCEQLQLFVAYEHVRHALSCTLKAVEFSSIEVLSYVVSKLFGTAAIIVR